MAQTYPDVLHQFVQLWPHALRKIKVLVRNPYVPNEVRYQTALHSDIKA